MGLHESLEEPVSAFMSKDYATVGTEDSIYLAAVAMQKAGTTEAIVMKGGTPAGIITERDILYRVVARGLIPQQVKAKDVMSSPLESVEESAKAGEAIARMSRLGLRRLAVIRDGKLVGLVTQKAVVSGRVNQNVVLPELAKPKTLNCPYCGAVVKSGDELSRHIDHAHVGLGLLEGDQTKW
jgi:signal-transduction protein with cAMP-binding, CBS, and nucleotidyltransferase domain